MTDVIKERNVGEAIWKKTNFLILFVVFLIYILLILSFFHLVL